MKNITYIKLLIQLTWKTLLQLLIFLLLIIGWGLNTYKFATSEFKHPYKEEFVRGLGIVVPPVGSILGYINLKDIIFDIKENPNGLHCRDLHEELKERSGRVIE